MVTDKQVRLLMKLINKEQRLQTAAVKAGMSEKTARKYRRLNRLPSQVKAVHDWQTRPNPFEEDWPWIQGLLEYNSGLEAKTIFEALQRTQPGKYQDGQLRSLQRHILHWRATAGQAFLLVFA